jgi:lysophospholipase L1-like esterase
MISLILLGVKMSRPLFRNGDRVVFAGDSITDCEKMTTNPPLGNGYVYIFSNLVVAKYPELDVDVVNAGISGNTVIDLKNRWEDDVLSYRPTWISILIGINDIHRSLNGQPALDPESYYTNYRDLLEAARKQLGNVNLILLTPFYISKTTIRDSFRRKILETIPLYIEKVEKLSKEFSAIYINLHEKFQKLLNYRPPQIYAPDAVHPTFLGHLIIAKTILETLENI